MHSGNPLSNETTHGDDNPGREPSLVSPKVQARCQTSSQDDIPPGFPSSQSQTNGQHPGDHSGQALDEFDVDTASDVDTNGGKPATWNPLWLQPAILAAFCGLFLSLIPALVVMLVYSQRNDGLGHARDQFRLLWGFGPTACRITSCPSSLYARVC